MQDYQRADSAQSLDRVAADGGRVQGAANTAGEFLNMIEDGQFSADLSNELADLAARMGDLSVVTGKKQKGKVTITIDFTTEQTVAGAMFMAVGKFAIKAPEEKRKPTLLFTDERNHFTRTQPRQGQFFGVREIDAEPGSVREIRG